MQIKLNNNIFIKYNDFHLPFHDEDLFYFELFKKHKEYVKHSFGRCAGMQEILNSQKGLENIVDQSTPTEDFEDATFRLNTMVMAKDGETISGATIADAIREANKSEKTVTSVMKEKLSDTNTDITTLVFPGDGVPQPQQRTKRKKKNKK